MKLLLDTHVALWAATAPDRLGRDVRVAIEDGANQVCLSVVSAWEIAIKQSLGKLDLPEPAGTWLPAVVRRTGLDILELNMAAALRIGGLPWHHRDPFDRLLVAQALEAGFSLVTRDRELGAYGVSVLAT